MEIELLADYILELGVDDWVAMAWVADRAAKLGVLADEDRVAVALEAAVRLARAGMVQFGTIGEHGWIDLDESPEEAAAAVEDLFRNAGPDIAGYHVWLRSTEAGLERGRDIIERSSPSASV